jgi:hypothetical protein
MKGSARTCLADTAVLVCSSDKYRDLWRPFFVLFFRYWPDCPCPLYLMTGSLDCERERVTALKVGDKDWSSGFIDALGRIPQTRVIVLMEDYFLTRPVDEDAIKRLLAYMDDRGAACLRLFPCPGPTRPCPDSPEAGEIDKGEEYRLSLQAAIWDRRTLMRLARSGESPWELERNGTMRTNRLDPPFLSVRRNPEGEYPIAYLCTAVIKGKWARETRRLCRRERLSIDLGARPVESLREYRERAGWPAWLREAAASLLFPWRSST